MGRSGGSLANLRHWLDAIERERYPKARELTIAAYGCSSNGTGVRLWKVKLQKLADETGLVPHVHHYPPRTSTPRPIKRLRSRDEDTQHARLRVPS
jgi:hypothetical protein